MISLIIVALYSGLLNINWINKQFEILVVIKTKKNSAYWPAFSGVWNDPLGP